MRLAGTWIKYYLVLCVYCKGSGVMRRIGSSKACLVCGNTYHVGEMVKEIDHEDPVPQG
jgi:hypothetical protein